ncbi:MAG: hypothetical protein K8W52_33820 [Deltaproteobacteria bacterium]|nr:hypothetical protein [Deltaproteobacteria bacterium]
MVELDAYPLPDAEERALFDELRAEACAFLRSHHWCRGIRRELVGYAVGGVIGVFLMQLEPSPPADEWLWVVVGDVPSVYMVIDDIRDPCAALEAYCELMEHWIDAARTGGDLSKVFPVAAAPTAEHADMLERRIAMIRESLLPDCRCDPAEADA